MFEKTKRRIGIWLAENREKTSQRRLIHSAGFWKDIHQVVIGLPDNFHEWKSLGDVVDLIRTKTGQPAAVVTFWIPPLLVNELDNHFPGMKRVTPSDLTYTRWYIPDKQSVTTRFGNSIDLVIDLSVDFKPDSAYIWAAFNRSFRVGFISWKNDWFYDLVIRCQPSTVPQQRIQHLKKILESLN